jgi:hypothetical protein
MRRQEATHARRREKKNPTIAIELDLGDKKHTICVLNQAGAISYGAPRIRQSNTPPAVAPG